MGFRLVMRFMDLYNSWLQLTLVLLLFHSAVHYSMYLVFSVGCLYRSFGNGLKWQIFIFLWVPELSHASATTILGKLLHKYLKRFTPDWISLCHSRRLSPHKQLSNKSSHLQHLGTDRQKTLFTVVGVIASSQSQSHITTDGQSVSMSWCEAHSGTFDQRRFFFFSSNYCLVFLGLTLWREVGSVICQSLSYCCLYTSSYCPAPARCIVACLVAVT
jgi:hypothetical protein